MQPLNLNIQLRNYLLLFLGCILFHVLGTWDLPLVDRDEPRFAEASREMRQRGDWIVPYFNGQYRFDKPPLTYWAQAASYRIFGENDFAARFPSTLAAGLTALAIFGWGVRIGGLTTGWSAAIMFTLSLQTFLHAKAAVADMWLVLFMTLAFWAALELLGLKQTFNAQPRNYSRASGGSGSTSNVQHGNATPPRRLWWWIFYLSIALAFLAKGPIGLIPLIAPVALMVRHRGSGAAQRFAFLRGLLLTTAIICLWAVPALVATHGEFLRVGIGKHVIGRSVGAMEGHGAKSIGIYLLLLPFYFVAVFLSLFPWSFKLPWLLKQLRRQRDWIDIYLLFGIFSVFGIFTLVATKLPHYTLPAFPLIALLLARRWCNGTSDAQDAIAGTRGRFKALAIGTASLWIGIALILPPLTTRFFPSYVLYQNAREHLRSDMEFGSLEFIEPSIVWYFRSKLNGFLNPLRRGNAVEFMSRPGPRLVILPSEKSDALFGTIPAEWKRFETKGINIPKGKHVDLTMLLKPN